MDRRFFNIVCVVFTLCLPIHVSVAQGEASPQLDPPTVDVPQSVPKQVMTQEQMATIIAELSDTYQSGDGGSLSNIQFVYNDVAMALVSDAANNRMRIIAPVAEADKLSQEHLLASMVSNFHLALDARYAIGNGVLYSTYIHPLKELTKEQLISAVRQVATLKSTFGTSYTSGELSYGSQSTDEQDI